METLNEQIKIRMQILASEDSGQPPSEFEPVISILPVNEREWIAAEVYEPESGIRYFACAKTEEQALKRLLNKMDSRDARAQTSRIEVAAICERNREHIANCRAFLAKSKLSLDRAKRFIGLPVAPDAPFETIIDIPIIPMDSKYVN